MLDTRKALPLAAPEDELRKKTEVILVEDDFSVLRALRRLLLVSGFKVRSFARPSALLTAGIPEPEVCLIFDLYLPQMTSVELYETLAASGCRCPLIFDYRAG
jgi:FixJ family two-component response regulator